MARQCTVCAHPSRQEIDAALVRGVSSYTLESSYNELSRASIERHERNGHIPVSLLKAQDAHEIGSADNVAAELTRVWHDVHRLKDKAEAEGDIRTALLGVDKALKAVELRARIAQLIDDSPQVNVMIDARVQQVILDALAPYAEARYAVAEALKGVHAGGNGGPSILVDKGDGSW
jgi:hypothetical protein